MRNYFLSLPAGRHGLSKEYLIIVIIAVLGIFTVAAQAEAQTWTAQTSGTAQSLLGVSFVDANTGWATGNSGTIVTTTNGGSTWTAQTSGTAQSLFSAYFVNSTTGWAVGSSGTILTTTNGGSTWTAQTSGVTVTLRGVYFMSATTGWTVGNNGTILTTTNGGSTWTAQTSGTGSQLRGVFFASATVGWTVGNNGTILTTTNGGSTWTSQTSGVDGILNGIYFVNSTTGWAVGDFDPALDNAAILATTNGGSTWTAQTSGTANGLTSVSFVNSTTGWVVGGSGTIRATTNGGSTWTAQTSGTAESFFGVYFVNSTTGWAVGTSGTILIFSVSSASSLSHPPLQFEEQQRFLALRLAPEAPNSIRVSSPSCAPEHCPVELHFAYDPLALHRGRVTRFIFYDDQNRPITSFTALPASAEEYQLTISLNGANGAVFGKLCAAVGAQESCAPVEGFADIVLDPDTFAWSDELLDAAREEYRLSFQAVELPTNYTVGETGAAIAIYEAGDVRRVVTDRFFAFSSRAQVLVPEIHTGSYVVRITPQNAEGKAGVAVEQRITVPLVYVPKKPVVPLEGVNEMTKEALFRLDELLRALTQLLRG